MRIRSANQIAIFLFLAFFCRPVNVRAGQIAVSEFGAFPNDQVDDAVSLRQAMDYCRSHRGTTLFFAPGVYDFHDDKAWDLMDGILNGRVKGNPQDSIFRPYYPYSKGLDFNGTRDITVEAAGAVLLCDGWMEPVSLNNCENIRINGLTIDYKRKPNSEGEIVEVQPDFFIARIDSAYPVSAVMPLCRMHFWDAQAHRLLPKEVYFAKYELVEPQTLKIKVKLDPGMKGNRIMIAHTFHFRPAILMLEAKNIRLDNVTIHSQPGMGIVGHRSEDICLSGLRIVPNAGCIMSTNTDATHFTSCKGLIRYVNCQFQGHGDDAANIHNYYLSIQKPAQGKGYDLILKDADWHAQVLDYPDKGDTLELVSSTTLAVVGKYVVKSRENHPEERRTQVVLNRELPEDFGNYYLINITRLPRVEITGCSLTGNRARGFLIKTRNVLIENNLICETTGTGIHVGAEGSWHEGPASADVTIRNNRILRCGFGAGTQNGACAIAVNVGAPDETAAGLHRNIRIENNIIEGEQSDRGIYISGASGVIVRFNEISGCAEPVKVEHSESVQIDKNYCKEWNQRDEPVMNDSVIGSELEKIKIEDQALRLLLDDAEKRFSRGSQEMDYFWRLILQQDSLNEARVTRIIDRFGWLGTDRVGETANLSIWLVIQHAPLQTQEKYLPLLKQSVEKGLSPGWHLAYLQDRILMYKGEKQIYGTQATYKAETGRFYIWMTQDPQSVNERRKQVGLGTIEEYAAKNNYLIDQQN